MRGTTLQTPRSVQKEGVLQALEQIRLQPMEKTMVRQAVPLQPMEDDGGADIHLQPMEDPTLEHDPMGSPHWSRLLAGPVAPWREEPTPGQVCWQDL